MLNEVASALWCLGAIVIGVLKRALSYALPSPDESCSLCSIHSITTPKPTFVDIATRYDAAPHGLCTQFLLLRSILARANEALAH